MIPRYVVRSSLYYNGISKRLEFTGIDTRTDAGHPGPAAASSRAAGTGSLPRTTGSSLPKETAKFFGLALEDEVVIATRTRFGAFNTGTLKIKGIYETDNFFIQSLVLCSFPFIQSLDLAGPGTASSLYLYFDDAARARREARPALARPRGQGFEATKPASANAAVAAVSSASPTYEVDTSGRDTTRLTLATIDEAVGLVRTVTAAVNAIGALIALVMLFIIAVSIFINLRMTINERLREIGTMRTIGVEIGRNHRAFRARERLPRAPVQPARGRRGACRRRASSPSPCACPSAVRWRCSWTRHGLCWCRASSDLAAIVAVITAFAALFSFFPARYGGRIRPVDALTRVF